MRSASNKVGLLITVGLLLICATGLEPIRPKTRPCPLPGIPDRDYQSGSVSQPKEAQSTVGLLLEVSSGAAVDPKVGDQAPRIRYFQLSTPGLAVDHCTIARVAFYIEEHGAWKLSLRAEQNAQMKPQGASTLFPGPKQRTGELFTDHLLRNEFFVRVRCLGGLPLQQGLPGFAPAAPVLVRMIPPGFWVQRGVPQEFGTFGVDPELPRYFNKIDRIEVEFFYR